jgi:hypothetical protein
MKFSPRSMGRISDATRWVERRLRNDPEYDGRWITKQRRQIRRIEVTDELLLPQTGEGTCTAEFLQWDHDSGIYAGNGETKTVVDAMRMHSKMASKGNDVGAYGIAWIPDDAPNDSPHNTPWEILTLQTPGPFYGIIKTGNALQRVNTSPPSDGDQCTVTVFDVFEDGHRTLWGYDPFGDGWADEVGGVEITAYNPPRENQESTHPAAPEKYWFEAEAGNCVFCMWHMRESKYYVINIENNLLVEGEDAAPATISVPCVGNLTFNPTDFIVADSGDGVATISLR